MPEEKYVAVAHRPVAKQQHGEAAFFDVDNTLMRGASLFHVARKMHQRGAFTLAQAAGLAWKQLKFVLRGENINDVHAVRDSALRLAAGITEEDIKALGEEVYDEMIASRIWPGAKALAEQHLRVGRKVWLVTATPIEVATVISTRLGLTGALGTVGETKDGFYTGRLVGDILHGAAKAVAVQGIADNRRTGPETLLGLQRLLQRHPAADDGGPPGGDQPGRPPAQARPRTQLAGLRLPLRPPGRHPGPQGSHSRRSGLRPLAGLLALPRPPGLTLFTSPSTRKFPDDTGIPGASGTLRVAGRSACRRKQKCPQPRKARAFKRRGSSTSYCGAGGASYEATCGASSWPYACDAS